MSKLSGVNPHAWKKSNKHGRHEYRALWVMPAPLSIKPFWKDVKQVWKYKTIRYDNGKKTTNVMFGITDLSQSDIDAKGLLYRVILHWAIENPCHQVLDTTFNEDYTRLRNSSSRENEGRLNRLVLSILQHVPGRTIPDKRAYVASNLDFTLKLLGIAV